MLRKRVGRGKQFFYEMLQSEVNKYKISVHLIIAGDLNVRVGNIPVPNVAGIFGESVMSENGKELRGFVTFNELKLTNTFFRKNEIYKYTWCGRGMR